MHHLSTTRSVSLLLAFIAILGACAAPPMLHPAVKQLPQITVVTAPADRVLASPSKAADPLARLLEDAEAPAASIEAPVLSTNLLAQLVHEEVNRVRIVHGLAPLAWATALLPVARSHADDMARHPYFGHTNLQGEGPTDRAERHGLSFQIQRANAVVEGVGENLFLTHRYSDYQTSVQGDVATHVFSWKAPEALAAQAVSAWLDSPSHRANLLSPLYGQQAVGIALGRNYTLFVTQNLAPGR